MKISCLCESYKTLNYKNVVKFHVPISPIFSCRVTYVCSNMSKSIIRFTHDIQQMKHSYCDKSVVNADAVANKLVLMKEVQFNTGAL